MPRTITREELNEALNPALQELQRANWLMTRSEGGVPGYDQFKWDVPRFVLSIGPFNLNLYAEYFGETKDDLDGALSKLATNLFRFFPNGYVDPKQIPNITEYYAQSLNGSTFKTPNMEGLTALKMFDLISAEKLQLSIGEESSVYNHSSRLCTTRSGTYLINTLSLSLKDLPVYDPTMLDGGNCEITSFWKLTEQGFELEKIECTNEDAEYIAYSGCLPGLEPLTEFYHLMGQPEILIPRLAELINEDKMGFVAAALLHQNSELVLEQLLNNPELYNRIIENISQNIDQANANQQPLAAKRLECARFNLQKQMLRQLLTNMGDQLPRHIYALWQKANAINPENTDITQLNNANRILSSVNAILSATNLETRLAYCTKFLLAGSNGGIVEKITNFFTPTPVQQLASAVRAFADIEKRSTQQRMVTEPYQSPAILATT